MIDEDLLKKANDGDRGAQFFVATGYAKGVMGFEQSPEKLLECADKGWTTALIYVILGYSYAQYGFTKDLDKLDEYRKKMVM